jgi:LAO/AO transport system kinase
MPGVPGRRGARGARGGSTAAAPLATDAIVEGVIAGDRTVLGRAITLIESNAAAHRDQAQEVLQALLPRTGGSIRVGITGIPGAGKSTLIEALGSRLTGEGHRVAVMAVDPSSTLTRGSILGDKTRMERLARDPRAFIRPSPTGGALGGVARKTRETMLVFEAAGYDVLLVETVGVGQSESTVRSMVDCFLLVLTAGGGDELQRLKRGVVEMADAVLINKADGEHREAARAAQREHEMALHYIRPATDGWTTEVLLVSALHDEGVGAVWEMIGRFREAATRSGALDARRRAQLLAWLRGLLEEGLLERFRSHPEVVRRLPEVERAVAAQELPPTRAALELLRAFEGE